MYVKIGEVKENRLSCGGKETLIHYQSFHDIYTEENGVPKNTQLQIKNKASKKQKSWIWSTVESSNRLPAGKTLCTKGGTAVTPDKWC